MSDNLDRLIKRGEQRPEPVACPLNRGHDWHGLPKAGCPGAWADTEEETAYQAGEQADEQRLSLLSAAEGFLARFFRGNDDTPALRCSLWVPPGGALEDALEEWE